MVDSPILEEAKFPLLGDLLNLAWHMTRHVGTGHHDAGRQLLGVGSGSMAQLVGVQVCGGDRDWGVEGVTAIRIVS